ncbi:helix-turn-helix domain-containing protein [Streptomyces sp. NPDC005498]|uniref:helix-turn-helix domain-containing protein n=1 Tax=Streptomyces sp. NPDC005498 TaxID=3364717 RepID=UPI00368541D7
MDSANQLGQFLKARRVAVSPGQAGLRETRSRRTRGLTQREVARLAGLSDGYYARLEQGRERHPSDQVLHALGRVLRLNADSARYLHSLALDRPRSVPQDAEVAPHIARLVEEWQDTPTLVLGPCLDILAVNGLGGALYSLALPYGNLVRFTFLDAEATTFYRDWQEVAEAGVAWLRATGGTESPQSRLAALVDELSADRRFRLLWRRHEVRDKTDDTKRLRHPAVGELTLRYQVFLIDGFPGQCLFTYQAEPGSSSAEALTKLRPGRSPHSCGADGWGRVAVVR